LFFLDPADCFFHRDLLLVEVRNAKCLAIPSNFFTFYVL